MFVSARFRAGGAGLMRVALDAAAEAPAKVAGKLYPFSIYTGAGSREQPSSVPIEISDAAEDSPFAVKESVSAVNCCGWVSRGSGGVNKGSS